MNLLANKPFVLGLCLLAMAAGAIVAKIFGTSTGLPEISNATVFTQPRALPAIELVDHHGNTFTNEQLQDHWSIIFFGFTHCPDVCPTTMSMLNQTYRHLQQLDTSFLPQVFMITVDPERDSAAKLAAYVPFFHPDFVGLTGTSSAIDELTKAMGVARQRVPTGDNDYTIDHTSALFIINPKGQMAAVSSAPHRAEILANDLWALSEK